MKIAVLGHERIHHVEVDDEDPIPFVITAPGEGELVYVELNLARRLVNPSDWFGPHQRIYFRFVPFGAA